MKTIGRSNDGSPIVTMTEDEHRLLSRLSHTVRGEKWFRAVIDSGSAAVINDDMSPAFAAINLFVEMGLAVNDLQARVDDLKEVLSLRK